MNKAVSSRNTKRGGRFAWGAAALCSALGLGAAPDLAQAQSICSEAGCPTTFAIAEKPLQKVPTTFKFQSRISQAKIPLGDAKLATVVVNLSRANGQTLCTETLSNVMIRDSVLNIDIGRGMSCQMDEVIANNNDLSFQVCIGGSENCLKPVSLGTVPQAIKASFAVQAQEAYKSQIAAQAHFAHRITPEPDLFTTNTISKGYYDFQTPTGATAMTGSLVSNPQTNAGGYIQWTPVNAADNILHVSSGASSGSARTLSDLASFIVHAGSTNLMGTLTTERGVTVKTGGLNVVQGGATVQAGGANVTGGIVVRPTAGVSMTTLDVQGNEVVTGSVTVTAPAGVALNVTKGGASVADGLTVSTGNSTVQSGNFVVAGAGTATIGGRVTVQSGGVGVTGASSFVGTTTFTDRVTVAANGLGVTGSSSFEGPTAFTGTSTFAGDTSFTPAMGQSTTFNGSTIAAGGLNVSAGGLNVTGGSTFNDPVTFTKPVTFAGGQASPSNSVLSGSVVDGTLTSADLSPTAGITNGQLAGGIASDKLAGGITNDQLAGGIGSDKLAGGIANAQLAGGITNDKLSGGITTSKMAPCDPASPTTSFCVSGAMILDGTITSADIAPNAGITNAQLAGGISGSKISGGSISSSQLAQNSVYATQLGLTRQNINGWGYTPDVPANTPETTVTNGTAQLLSWGTAEHRGVCVLSGMKSTGANSSCTVDTSYNCQNYFCYETGLEGKAVNAVCRFTCF